MDRVYFGPVEGPFDEELGRNRILVPNLRSGDATGSFAVFRDNEPRYIHPEEATLATLELILGGVSLKFDIEGHPMRVHPVYSSQIIWETAWEFVGRFFEFYE